MAASIARPMDCGVVVPHWTGTVWAKCGAAGRWLHAGQAMLPIVRTDSDRPVYEVEAKYRVRDGAAVVVALGRHGIRLSPPVRQDDQAYAPASWRYGMSKVGVPFARLRTQRDHHLFTVKRPVTNEMACVEHETAVADRGQMHGALLTMGFAPTVRIVKSRQTGRWGPVSLCLDIVEGVGVFLELEQLLDPDEAGDVAQSDLDRLARSLGVEGHRVLETYDSLVRAAGLASAVSPSSAPFWQPPECSGPN